MVPWGTPILQNLSQQLRHQVSPLSLGANSKCDSSPAFRARCHRSPTFQWASLAPPIAVCWLMGTPWNPSRYALSMVILIPNVQPPWITTWNIMELGARAEYVWGGQTCWKLHLSTKLANLQRHLQPQFSPARASTWKNPAGGSHPKYTGIVLKFLGT